MALEETKNAAFTWQQHRAHAEWHEVVWLAEDAALSAWVSEIHGLFGSAAELVLVSIEAEAEKLLLQDAVEQESPGTPLYAGLTRAVRFFAEGQMNYLVMAGHGAANIVLRTMCLHLHFREVVNEAALGVKLIDLVPRSLSRKAWVSLNAQTGRELKRVAKELAAPELVDLSNSLRALESQAPWKMLNEFRGEQYHRWRGESPGVTGVNFRDEGITARAARGEPIKFPDSASKYVEGDGVLSRLIDATTETLAELGNWMPLFLNRWSAAFGALRGQVLQEHDV